jgi:hypothetical protein
MGIRPQHHEPHEHAARPSRTAFHIIDAVTIGAMVGVGVYCSRAHVFGGRATRFAASSILAELSKLVKGVFLR